MKHIRFKNIYWTSGSVNWSIRIKRGKRTGKGTNVHYSFKKKEQSHICSILTTLHGHERRKAVTYIPTMSEIPKSTHITPLNKQFLHKVRCQLKNQNFLLKCSFSLDSFFSEQDRQAISQRRQWSVATLENLTSKNFLFCNTRKKKIFQST